MSLNSSAPIYVTRATAEGTIAAYSLSIWMTLLAILLVWSNIVFWGVIGLIYAVKVIV